MRKRSKWSGALRLTGLLRRASPGRSSPLLAVLLLALAACTPAPRPSQASDVEGASDLAREAGDLLLRLSAYDYALAGTLSGQRTYVVGPERYAAVVRASAAGIQRFTGQALEATLRTQGPLRDRLVTLADGLVDVSRDANAYADGGDSAVFTRVATGVARAWDDLRALSRLLKPADEELSAVIARGSSIAVLPKVEKVNVVSVGPFATAAEAAEAAQRIGAVEAVAPMAPFVVRVRTYADKADADAAIAAIRGKGFTGLATEEERFTFTRVGPTPAAELWSEPERVFDTWESARRVAVSPNAAWVATGSDDGTVAIFTGDGTLRSLPKFNAGVAYLAFSEDDRWLFGGGQTLSSFMLPDGVGIGVQVRLPSPAQQVVYVPRAYYFAAIAKGEGGGVIAARSPDGIPLASFPIDVPASGGALATTARGELFMAWTEAAGTTDVEVLDLTRDRQIRGILRAPGTLRALAVDPAGILGAVMTDKGVYRFGPKDTDPARTLTRIGDPVNELAFGADGTLYLMTKTKISAHGLGGEVRWSAPLIDGRRLAIGSRPVVLDGADRLLTFTSKGLVEDLGVTGNVQDLSVSSDGKRVAVLTEGYRALIFKLP